MGAQVHHFTIDVGCMEECWKYHILWSYWILEMSVLVNVSLLQQVS